MSKTQFEACLNDQGLFDKINAERDLAGKTFKVNSTPTFFINGDRKPGEIPAQALDETLAPYLK
jgi:protein-disulfide isomerase